MIPAALLALLVAAAGPTPGPSGRLVPGTYRQIDTVTRKPLAPGNLIVVVAAKGGRMAFSINAIKQTDAALDWVVGVIPGALPASWSHTGAPGNCRLAFASVPHGFRVTQDAGFGDCGFGAGISATGTYLLAPEKAL